MMLQICGGQAVRDEHYWVVTGDPGGLGLAGPVRRLDDAVACDAVDPGGALEIPETVCVDRAGRIAPR